MNWTKKRIEIQLNKTEKLIDQNWRTPHEDHSYSLGSSIKRTEDENSERSHINLEKWFLEKNVCFKIMKLI